MLKGLVIFAVLFACLPVRGEKEHPKASGNQKITQAVEQKPSDSPSVYIVNSVEKNAPKGQEEDARNHTDSYLRHLLLPETLASIGLFVAGVIGIGVAIHTLKAMQRTATLAEKTLVLQFRPKIAIRGGYAAGIGKDGDANTGGKVEFTVVNAGGTPAHIYKSQFVVKVVDYQITTFRLFDGATSLGEFNLQPGEGRNAETPFSHETANAIKDEISRPSEELATERKAILFMGNLWYKDDLGIARSVGVFRRLAPKERNFVVVEGSDTEYSD